MTKRDLVYSKLKEAKNKGITVNDFPRGFRLAAYVGDLRKGHVILTQDYTDTSQGYERVIARYIYIRKRKGNEVEEDYQSEVLNNLEAVGIYLDNEYFGYKRLLKKVKLNKTTLDFINREITNYNMRYNND